MAAVDFRCEQCGKLLRVEASSGTSVKCPHCMKTVTVPAGLASLPRPQVPPNAVQSPSVKASAPATVSSPAAKASAPVVKAAAAAPAAASAQPTVAGAPGMDDEVLMEPSGGMAALAAVMPWILSLFLHVGVVIIAMFGSMVAMKAVSEKPSVLDITVPGETFSENPGGVINPGDSSSVSEARQNVRRTVETGYSRHATAIGGGSANSNKPVAVIGVGGGGPSSGGYAKLTGISSGGGKRGPRSTFFGSGGNAHHVVFVIDRSGSMTQGGVFGQVKQQMRVSIGRLAEVQDFHIIFFNNGPALENPPKRLVDATQKAKGEAAIWIEEMIAEEQTDPIPALKRAFDVLAKADPGRKGKQIFLLTDGEFKDNEAVKDFLRGVNRSKEVHINTYLYSSESVATKVMMDIAKEHGGNFKQIGIDE